MKLPHRSVGWSSEDRTRRETSRRPGDSDRPKKVDEIKRLLKSSDADAVEIAKRVGCSAQYVHMVRTAMERSGEL